MGGGTTWGASIQSVMPLCSVVDSSLVELEVELDLTSKSLSLFGRTAETDGEVHIVRGSLNVEYSIVALHWIVKCLNNGLPLQAQDSWCGKQTASKKMTKDTSHTHTQTNTRYGDGKC